MQLTIDLPTQLAERLRPELDKLPEIIEQGLERRQAANSRNWREVVAFLARGPRPEEIISFQPSEAHRTHSRDLLEKNRAGNLSPIEQGEMEQISQINYLVMLLKAEARKVVAGQVKA
jgi:hypothetical protein